MNKKLIVLGSLISVLLGSLFLPTLARGDDFETVGTEIGTEIGEAVAKKTIKALSIQPAADMTLSVKEGYSVNVKLPTIADLPPLKYVLVSSPVFGTLSGVAPNVVYKSSYGAKSTSERFKYTFNNIPFEVEVNVTPDKIGSYDKAIRFNLKDFSSVPVDGRVNTITVRDIPMSVKPAPSPYLSPTIDPGSYFDGSRALVIFARAKVDLKADQGQAANYTNMIVHKYLSYQLCTRTVVSQTVQATIYNYAGESVVLTAKKIDLTVWHDYLLKYDGTIAQLYVDNVLVASQPFSGDVKNTTNDLVIGKTPWGYNFRGLIEDAKVFTDALYFV